MTLKQSQSHQTYHDIVDSKQGYNHAKIEKSCLNDVWEKANVTFFSDKDICQLYSLNMYENPPSPQKSGIFMIYLI